MRANSVGKLFHFSLTAATNESNFVELFLSKIHLHDLPNIFHRTKIRWHSWTIDSLNIIDYYLPSNLVLTLIGMSGSLSSCSFQSQNDLLQYAITHFCRFCTSIQFGIQIYSKANNATKSFARKTTPYIDLDS